MDVPIWSFKKIRFYIIFGVIIFGLLSMFDFFSGEPKNLKDAKSYILQSEDVVAQVGKIQGVDLLKWRSVYSDGNTSAYREFRFRVKGERQQVTVVVKADSISGNNTEPRFSIVSVDNH
jgi:hypothetical protein